MNSELNECREQSDAVNVVNVVRTTPHSEYGKYTEDSEYCKDSNQSEYSEYSEVNSRWGVDQEEHDQEGTGDVACEHKGSDRNKYGVPVTFQRGFSGQAKPARKKRGAGRRKQK